MLACANGTAFGYKANASTLSGFVVRAEVCVGDPPNNCRDDCLTFKPLPKPVFELLRPLSANGADMIGSCIELVSIDILPKVVCGLVADKMDGITTIRAHC